MSTQKIDPKVIFASDAPAIDKPPVFSDKTKGWDVARANDGRPQIKEMNKMQQDTDLKILWLNENAVLPYDASIDYPDGAVTLKDGSFKQLSSGSWVEFLDDFADKDAVKRGIANRYDSSLTYNSGERVVLANGDIVKSTINGNANNPNTDMTGWVKTNSAGQIFDESGLSQQQWNNGVESIADLLAIANPENGSRVFVKSRNSGTGKGGGYFEFHAGSEKDDGGIFFKTPTGSWHRITLETWKNVQWWGAVGDGITDDTDAIKSAVAALCDAAVVWNGNSNPSTGSHCTLYLAPSEGSYVVSDTIYITPYLRIKGDSTKGAALSGLYTKASSRIEARFPNAENYKWVISTVNRTRADGVLTPWNSVYSGTLYDTGVVTGCFGSCVEDIVVFNGTPDKRVYGGIRMQNAPQCSVEAYITGFDVCLSVTGSWDARIDVNTEYYKCGVFAWGDVNNLRLNGYQQRIRAAGTVPMTQQMNILKDNDITSGLSFDMSTQTYGAYISYAYGFDIGSLISEHSACGVFISQSVGSISALYAEGNTRSVACVGSSFSIGSLTGIGNTSGFNLGTGSSVTLNSMDGSHTSNFLESASIYYAHIDIKRNIGAPYHYAINVEGGRNTVYLDAVNGKDTNSGLFSYQAVKTLSQALLTASSYDPNTLQVNNPPSIKSKKNIVIMDSSTHTLNTWTPIANTDLYISNFLGSNPTFKVIDKNLSLYSSDIHLNGVNIQRTYDNTWQASQAFFVCYGKCSVTLQSPRVDLGFPLVGVVDGQSADVSLSILGGVGDMTHEAKYVSTASGNTKFNVFIRLNNTSINLNASADNGVTVPVSSWVQKSVSAVV